MKKVSILIALALLVTVGGVYATWVYSGAEVGDRTSEHTQIGVTGYTNDTAKGFFSVTNTIEILIDDEKFVDPTNGTPYKAVFVGNGKMTITFNPASGADSDVINNGVKMKATLTLTGPDASALTLGDTEIVLNSGNPCKSAEIEAQDVIDCLVLNGGTDLILDELSEYNTFKTALGTPKLVITISEID